MRPHKLTLEGFTSFRDKLELDFTGLDLFAITGPTGAGKSSLIDAICFALYGQVPRVGDDYKQLISHGAERLSVLLEFGVGKDRYRIARTARPDKPAQQRLERVTPGGAEPLADRAREIRDRGRPHPRSRLRRLHALGRPPAGPVRRVPEGRAQGAPQDPGRAPEPHRLRAHAAAREPEKLGREDRGRLHQAPARNRLRERHCRKPSTRSGPSCELPKPAPGRPKPPSPPWPTRAGSPNRSAHTARTRRAWPRTTRTRPPAAREPRRHSTEPARRRRRSTRSWTSSRRRRMPTASMRPATRPSSPPSPSPTSSSACNRATPEPRGLSPTSDESRTMRRSRPARGEGAPGPREGRSRRSGCGGRRPSREGRGPSRPRRAGHSPGPQARRPVSRLRAGGDDGSEGEGPRPGCRRHEAEEGRSRRESRPGRAPTSSPHPGAAKGEGREPGARARASRSTREGSKDPCSGRPGRAGEGRLQRRRRRVHPRQDHPGRASDPRCREEAESRDGSEAEGDRPEASQARRRSRRRRRPTRRPPGPPAGAREEGRRCRQGPGGGSVRPGQAGGTRRLDEAPPASNRKRRSRRRRIPEIRAPTRRHGRPVEGRHPHPRSPDDREVPGPRRRPRWKSAPPSTRNRPSPRPCPTTSRPTSSSPGSRKKPSRAWPKAAPATSPSSPRTATR